MRFESSTFLGCSVCIDGLEDIDVCSAFSKLSTQETAGYSSSVMVKSSIEEAADYHDQAVVLVASAKGYADGNQEEHQMKACLNKAKAHKHEEDLVFLQITF